MKEEEEEPGGRRGRVTHGGKSYTLSKDLLHQVTEPKYIWQTSDFEKVQKLA